MHVFFFLFVFLLVSEFSLFCCLSLCLFACVCVSVRPDFVVVVCVLCGCPKTARRRASKVRPGERGLARSCASHRGKAPQLDVQGLKAERMLAFRVFFFAEVCQGSIVVSPIGHKKAGSKLKTSYWLVPKGNFPHSLPDELQPYLVSEHDLRHDCQVPEDQSVGGQSADIRNGSTDDFQSSLLPMVGIVGCLVRIRRHAMSSLFDIVRHLVGVRSQCAFAICRCQST